MQTRRKFLSLTTMAAVATAIPSVATHRPTKGKYQVVLLGHSDGKLVVEDHFFFDSPPTENLKSECFDNAEIVSCRVYRVVAPRRRLGVSSRSGVNRTNQSGDITEFVHRSIRFDQRIIGEGPVEKSAYSVLVSGTPFENGFIGGFRA